MGHLVPPGTLSPVKLEGMLIEAMDDRRFMAGLGVPSVPTRYVVSMNPADRAWFDPRAEERLSAALAEHAENAGYLILGDIVVQLRADRRLALGRPYVWIGFAEGDLLVLANPSAATSVFEDADASA